MKHTIFFSILVILSAMYFIGCSDDDSSSDSDTPPDTILKVIVNSKADTTDMVENANVVVYQAETSQAVTRAITGNDGVCTFKLDQGNYYLSVTAQGYYPSPAPSVTPVPFFVTVETTSEQIRSLLVNDEAGPGYILGKVEQEINQEINNVLIIAENSSSLACYSGISGPDGVFVIYNLPLGVYNIKALKSGYMQSEAVIDTLTTLMPNCSVTILMSSYPGSNYSGKLNFLAGAVAKITDVVLRDPVTLDLIPGLTTNTDMSDQFVLNNIPDGNFILWASLKNDGNVMDPDKNLGGIGVSFPANSGEFRTIDITGAINIISPTNSPDSIYAELAVSQTPTFTWKKESSYSSVKEYIIEIRDMNGNKIWGGFSADSVIMHEKIPGDYLSFTYPSPPAASALKSGETYQWKIYADNNDDPNMQGLLSMSEDLLGIFRIPSPKLSNK